MFQPRHFGILPRTVFSLIFIAAAHLASAATNTVTTTADDNSSGSLRYLIANSATNDTIVFAPGLSGATILLTNYALNLNKSLNIDASALPAGIQINGNHQGTVFILYGSNTLTALTITNGYAPPYGPGNYVGDGGGVLNYGALTLNRCTVAGNIAVPIAVNPFFPPWGHGGGGIANFGILTANQCTVTGNIVTNGVGDGIYNDGTLVMNGCTLSGNGIAVGMYCPKYCGQSSAHTTLNQCTLAGNGGGISTYAINPVVIYQCTLTGTAGASSGGSVTTNSIIVAAGYPSNAIPDSANNIYTANGNLSPLGYYGGPTQTMPPLPGSPAIDNGNDAATNSFATDQRGSARFAGLHIDCGAVESVVPASAPFATTLPATNIGLTSALLNATVNQNGAATTCYFQYGTTTNYGSATAVIPLSTGIAAVSNNLTGLLQGTLYHFRIVATNILGAAYGADFTFQTGVPRIVSNNNDSGPGSLRDVVASFAIGDTISFASNLSGQTILLTGGQITLSNSFTLDASTLPAGLTIDGHTNGRIFLVTNNATVFLDSLTITNGKSSASGGGIYNLATLTLNRCRVTGNSSSSSGGGVANQGTLTVTKCTIAGNTASSTGGGINSIGGLTVSQSTLSGNSSADSGGGLGAFSGAVLYQSTISANTAANLGGGAYNGNNESVIMYQCTVSGNSATNNGGGGICNFYTAYLTLFNSVVAGNTGPDIRILVGVTPIPINTLGGTNIIGGDPMLAPLGNYGGLTQTMPPLSGSPAIDNGSDTATNMFTGDQRDLPRLAGLHVDLGAVESAFAPAAPLAVTQPATAIDTNIATLNATVTPNGLVTTYYFLYGTNASYSAFSPPLTLTAGATVVTYNLTGLSPATTYHFRIIATNNLGLSYGDDLTFQTRSPIHIVSNTNDSGMGSLRDAVANYFIGDTVILATNLSGKTILLTGGQINLDKSITLDASALPGRLTIDALGNGRVFQVGGSATVLLDSLVITNGNITGDGGGIFNFGNLTLNNCAVAGCTASGNGGGIHNAGTLALNRSTVAGNRASLNGGGIYGSPTLSQSTLSGNSAGNLGGGIFNGGVLNQSTLFGNTANQGGGIYTSNTQAVVNQSTLSGNVATNGGGGICVQGFTRATLSNSIVAGNFSSSNPDIRSDAPYYLPLILLGANITNGNPLLSPLGNYGGPTLTMLPLPDSPAIDNCTTGTGFTNDQRGLPRISGFYADIGAVESSYPPAAPLVVTQPATVLSATSASLNAAVTPHSAVTTAYFQYGTTTNYSVTTTNVTSAAGAAPISFNATGLLPRTVYHFRAVASNSFGGSVGADLTLLTGGFTDLVSNTNDNGSGSLRDVVQNFIAGDNIAFAASLSGKSILLTNGPITLDRSVTIDASSLSAGLAIDGNKNGRVFQVPNNTNIIVVLNSLTITNGKVLSDSGGGIYNAGTLTLNQCTVAGNASAYSGGGIYNWGMLTVNQSTMAGNTASITGGGILSSNTLTVTQSTLSSNSASGGGGIHAIGVMTLYQSTLAGNTANIGGGIYLNAFAMLNQCTISANYATNEAGGIYNPNSVPRVTNCIVTGNFSATNSNFNYLAQPWNMAANLTNGNPMLAPLGYYGGLTQTMPPLSNSPAIDACTSGTSFTTDQRGFPRFVDGNGDSVAVADIGAVEFIFYPPGPGSVTSTKKLGDGTFQLGFPNNTGQSYTVFATTNWTSPVDTWSNLGPALETPAGSGQYQFVDPAATNYPSRFYRVRSP